MTKKKEVQLQSTFVELYASGCDTFQWEIAYWKKELEEAKKNNNPDHIERCEFELNKYINGLKKAFEEDLEYRLKKLVKSL